MSRSRRAVAIAVAALAACASLQPAPSKPPAFGAAVSAEEIARFDISIPPSGAGLPKGGGSAKQGAAVYAAKCLACHGDKGAGKPADALAGGSRPLAPSKAGPTAGSYLPYAAPPFGHVRRADAR